MKIGKVSTAKTYINVKAKIPKPKIDGANLSGQDVKDSISRSAIGAIMPFLKDVPLIGVTAGIIAPAAIFASAFKAFADDSDTDKKDNK